MTIGDDRETLNLHEEATELRRQAHSIWVQQQSDKVAVNNQLSEDSIARKLYELEVHQIELELQNDELIRTKIELEESKSVYLDLYNFAPVGYCKLSEAGLIIQANLTLAKMLGKPRRDMINQPLSQFISHESQDDYYRLRLQSKEKFDLDEAAICELQMIAVDGSAFWAELTLNMEMDSSGTLAPKLMIRDINRSKQQEEQILTAEARWKFAIEGAGDGLWDWNITTGNVFYSQRFKEMLGFSDDEISNSVDEWKKRIHEDDIASVMSALQPYLDGDSGVFKAEYRMQQKNGYWLWVAGRGMSIENDISGKPLRMIFINSDISEYKQIQSKLKLAASVFRHASEGIMITKSNGTIIDINHAFTEITGYTRDEVIGNNPRLLNSGRHSTEFFTRMWDALSSKGFWVGEVWNRRKNGEEFPVMQSVSKLGRENGKIKYYVSLFSDISTLKDHEKELEQIAHFDVLTDLPNRVLLADRLHQAMSQAQRRDQMVAVVFLDLDGFKDINDSYGHKTGDQVLITVAARMKEILREGDTLSRFGGDEFVAVMVDVNNAEESVVMLNRLLTAAAEPILVDGHRLQVSASLGVTYYPQHEEIDADQLLRQADQAMYQAKQSGKNRYHIFDAVNDREMRGHHENIERIRRALRFNEFRLYYQPKVNMKTGAITGAEALIRWLHPDKGLLTPGLFLPAIEGHEVSITVGEWVIETALKQMQTWKKSGLEIAVSVNISAKHLQQSNFTQHLQSTLARYLDVPVENLELEVLETSALQDITSVSKVIEDCAALGIQFALDDFGTGYSSLTYLKRLKVDVLKIDQSFVRDMLADPEDMAILDGVINLADAFRCKVIAEGVETVEQGEFLLHLGCEHAQGYGIAWPMPADQISVWAMTWEPPLNWQNSFRLTHEKKPLLYSIIEHRAWIKLLSNYLKGITNNPPVMDYHKCNLAILLKPLQQGDEALQEIFNSIDPLHRSVHELAQKLSDGRRNGHEKDMQAGLDELLNLRDELTSKINLILKQG